jgi:hypothetical protein
MVEEHLFSGLTTGARHLGALLQAGVGGALLQDAIHGEVFWVRHLIVRRDLRDTHG